MTSPRPGDRDAALELLRSQHHFPGPYVFRAVITPEAAPRIVSAVGAALAPGGQLGQVEERPSRNGRYVSVRLHTTLPSAEAVLEVYDLMARLDGVIMSL